MSVCFGVRVATTGGMWDTQWKKMQTHFPSFNQAQLFVLADFNSVLMPSRDSAVPNDHESKATVEARKTEIHALSQLNVTDAHLLMHAHHISLPEKSGWTLGFPSAVRPSPHKKPKNTRARAHTEDMPSSGRDRRRKIDRILLRLDRITGFY